MAAVGRAGLVPAGLVAVAVAVAVAAAAVAAAVAAAASAAAPAVAVAVVVRVAAAVAVVALAAAALVAAAVVVRVAAAVAVAALAAAVPVAVAVVVRVAAAVAVAALAAAVLAAAAVAARVAAAVAVAARAAAARAGRAPARPAERWRRTRTASRRRLRWRRAERWRRRELMLSPKRVKHRKQHRGRRAGLSRGQVKVQFGEYGLKSMDAGWLTNRQIEAARIAMTRKIKRGGKVWINVYPDKPYTKKPAETRMGSGKGSPEGWVAVVKPGRVMFELAGVPEDLAREAMRLAGHKLPGADQIRDARGGLMARASDLRDYSDVELAEHIDTARKELFGLRFQHATGELDNTATLNRAKREIARALTVAREREIDAES